MTDLPHPTRSFTAGTTRSDDLLRRFDRDLALEQHWLVSHYPFAKRSGSQCLT